MSFVLKCPHCGVREVSDFAYGGEVTTDELPEQPSLRELAEINYFRANRSGPQLEWWFHRAGCRTWFQAERNTATNEIIGVGLPGSFEK